MRANVYTYLVCAGEAEEKVTNTKTTNPRWLAPEVLRTGKALGYMQPVRDCASAHVCTRAYLRDLHPTRRLSVCVLCTGRKALLSHVVVCMHVCWHLCVRVVHRAKQQIE